MSRTIAHISDLHFGHEDPVVAAALMAELRAASPSVVAVSGDLTQRARESEFVAAREYLAQLPAPYVVVPGNHDIPLFDLASRFARPLERYTRHITDDLAPLYRDEGLAILGVNTARSLTVKNGRISHEQIEALRAALCPLGDDVFKCVVTHHQFIPAPGEDSGGDLVGRAGLALRAIESCGVDLLLAGHLHRGFTGDVRAHHPHVERSIVVAQCGTSISTRSRGEPNGYNWIDVARDRISIVARAWDGTRFADVLATHYAREGHHWREVN